MEPKHFRGSQCWPDDDFILFLERFEVYSQFCGLNEIDKCLALPCFLDGLALRYYYSIKTTETQNNFNQLKKEFLDKYDTQNYRLFLEHKLYATRQETN
jgi:hypothetical protein